MRRSKNRFITNPVILGTYIKIKRPLNKKKLAVKILAPLFLLWLIGYSSLFKIKTISLPDTKIINRTDLEKLIWRQTETQRLLILPQTNLWLFSKKQLARNLSERYALTDLRIKKKILHQLKLEFTEKFYQLAWHEGENYYYLDGSSAVILQNSIRPDNLLIIDNLGDSKAGERQINVSPDYLAVYLQLSQSLKNSLPELTIEQYIADDQPETIKFKVRGGPLLYFSSKEGIEAQVNKLKALKQEVLVSSVDFNNKLYIDLRFGDRVFYQ